VHSGGARKNRFGLSSSDAKEIERLISQQVRYQKAALDPLMRELTEEEEGITVEEGAKRAETERHAAVERRSAAEGSEDDEQRMRGFEARIELSRLDGKAAVLGLTDLT
jgi:hypothetical protein